MDLGTSYPSGTQDPRWWSNRFCQSNTVSEGIGLNGQVPVQSGGVNIGRSGYNSCVNKPQNGPNKASAPDKTHKIALILRLVSHQDCKVWIVCVEAFRDHTVLAESSSRGINFLAALLWYVWISLHLKHRPHDLNRSDAIDFCAIDCPYLACPQMTSV